MDQTTIIKELSESFHVIDCQWEDMKEALTLCILKMAEYDINKAWDMWHTLLIRNKRRLKEEDVARELVDDFLYKISSAMYHDFFDYSSDNIFFIENVVPLMQNNIDLLDIIYGEAYCGGIGKYGWEDSSLYLFVDIVLLGNTDIIRRVFSKLLSNKHMNDITIGDFLLKVANLLNDIFSDDDYPDFTSLNTNVKSVLLDCADTISNSEEKAESKLAIITIK